MRKIIFRDVREGYIMTTPFENTNDNIVVMGNRIDSSGVKRDKYIIYKDGPPSMQDYVSPVTFDMTHVLCDKFIIHTVSYVGRPDRTTEFYHPTSNKGIEEMTIKAEDKSSIMGGSFGNQQLDHEKMLEQIDSIMITSIKGKLSEIITPFIFEVNDGATRDKIISEIEDMFKILLGEQCIANFAILCDGGNNTPQIIDEGKLVVNTAVRLHKDGKMHWMKIEVSKDEEEPTITDSERYNYAMQMIGDK